MVIPNYNIMKKEKSKFKSIIKEYFSERELNELFISTFFRFLAVSLISIFIPVYLLTTGHNLSQIIVYYLIFYTSISIFIGISMYLSSKIGTKKIMALGSLLFIIYYPLLYFIDKGLYFGWPALIHGLSVALFFSGFHLIFTKFCERKEYSVFTLTTVLSGIIGPVIGGIIIFYYSFNMLFIISSVLLTLSVIPLFMTKDFKFPYEKFSPKLIVKTDTKRKAYAYQLSALLAIVAGIFWPLFIYLTLKNVIPLGIISSLTSFLMIFGAFYVRRKADSDNKMTLILGVFLNSPSWLLRILLLSPIGLFISNFYSDFSKTFIDIPFNNMVYEKAKVCKSRMNYFLFREYNFQIGRLVILILALIFANLFWMFIISFFITFGYLILANDKKY